MSVLTLERPSAPLLSVLLFVTMLFQVKVTEVCGLNEETRSLPQCICVPLHLCKNEAIKTINGGTIINIRQNCVIYSKNNKSCSNDEETYCKNPIDPPENKNISDEGDRTICGHWNSGGEESLIIGQSHGTAKFAEFPWMVAILEFHPHNNSNTYLCGGSLIHPKVVLTVIHCITGKDLKNLVIRAGEWDIRRTLERLPYQEGRVLKVIEHEKYDTVEATNDVALIIVNQPFLLKENVGTICLPSQGYEFGNKRCYASGWGKDKFGSLGIYQDIMKKIDLPIVPRDLCQALLRKTSLGYRFTLFESFICAGGEKNKDTCEGDGGSPLVCPLENNPEQFHQAGIVNWGMGCGKEVPGVYTNVAMFRQWIDERMNEENLDTSFYDPNYIPKNQGPDIRARSTVHRAWN